VTAPASGGALRSARVEMPADPEELFAEIERRGWGDGLPVLPPTPERVAAFVAGAGAAAEEKVAELAPTWSAATVEKIAVNAVMAGCLPEHMPILLAAVRAVAQPAFNLSAIQATTHPCAVLMVVSGSVAGRLGMEYGYGAFGPGNRANATIGRAIRLVLMNIGGARPGQLDRATQGSPAKYTYCVAENEERSPWPPLRAALGYGPDEATVTVLAGEAPHNVNDHGSNNAAGVLRQIASTMATPGNNNVYMKGGDSFVFLGPEHAQQLAAEDLDRDEVCRRLFEAAQVPHELFGQGQLDHIRSGLDEQVRAMTAEVMYVGLGPQDIQLVVVGGDGRHSAWVPTFGMTHSCSEVIR
jgi:hypothetical protein